MYVITNTVNLHMVTVNVSHTWQTDVQHVCLVCAWVVILKWLISNTHLTV